MGSCCLRGCWILCYGTDRTTRAFESPAAEVSSADVEDGRYGCKVRLCSPATADWRMRCRVRPGNSAANCGRNGRRDRG